VGGEELPVSVCLWSAAWNPCSAWCCGFFSIAHYPHRTDTMPCAVLLLLLLLLLLATGCCAVHQ
jgi:drug/metabolite transporter (DMT)-like permease